MKHAQRSVMLAIMVLFYEAYMIYNLVSGYLAGGEDAPSLGVLIAGCLLLGAGGIGVLIFAVRAYLRSKAAPPDGGAEPPAEPGEL
ncbi:MAG: hypothetical protein LUH51_02815 [Firmicutes bacterium]|nr:hypothetical protein [Bacillota bacterium]